MGRGRRSRRRLRRRLPKSSACAAASSRPEALGGRDLITGLPDNLRASILALLPGKEAARTAVLSSCWRHVWYNSPLNLNLTDLLDRRPSAPPLTSTLSDLLSHHTGPVRLLRISVLDLPWLEWPKLESLCEAFDNKRIQHLLFRGCSKDFILPQALISGGSLATLAMEFCQFKDPAAALPHLMHLRVLKLSDCGSLGQDVVDVISSLRMLVGLELRQLCASCNLRLRFESLQVLGLHSVSGGKILSIDAPNLQELSMYFMSCGTRHDLEAMVSNLPRLHCLKILFPCSSSPTLCIRSMSLKTLVLDNIWPVDVLITDTPNLGHLHIRSMKISKKNFDKMLSSLPMLRTLELTNLFHSSLFEEKFCLTSESLQYLQIESVLPLKDFSIVDAPSLQSVRISHGTFNLSNVEVINAPRITLGYLYAGPHRHLLYPSSPVLVVGMFVPADGNG